MNNDDEPAATALLDSITTDDEAKRESFQTGIVINENDTGRSMSFCARIKFLLTPYYKVCISVSFDFSIQLLGSMSVLEPYPSPYVKVHFSVRNASVCQMQCLNK